MAVGRLFIKITHFVFLMGKPLSKLSQIANYCGVLKSPSHCVTFKIMKDFLITTEFWRGQKFNMKPLIFVFDSCARSSEAEQRSFKPWAEISKFSGRTNFHIFCGKETPTSSASGRNCRPFSKYLTQKEGFSKLLPNEKM